MRFSNRFYRDYSNTLRWKSFGVRVETTDLFIRARKDLSEYAKGIVEQNREEIREHILRQDCFLTSLQPVTRCEGVPAIIENMYSASEIANVGPMAAVAGAIAESVGMELLGQSEEVIVENGGDIYLKVVEPVVISIYVGDSPFSGRIGIRIDPDETPMGICTSSGKIGHSISFGRADAATIISYNTALSDAVATGMCNMVTAEDNIETAIEYAMSISKVRGAVVIYGDKLAAKGDVEFANPY
ncbi:MAG: UPF0280 family protein [Spirochaetota bacterium]|nr:UPF0280 family protein [Spirochaetota bacterium]